MVCSSGASTAVTKSYCPSVAYWETTLTPICSTSWFTSAIRPGWFFSVRTPSAVRFVNIKNVGISGSSQGLDGHCLNRTRSGKFEGAWRRGLRSSSAGIKSHAASRLSSDDGARPVAAQGRDCISPLREHSRGGRPEPSQPVPQDRTRGTRSASELDHTLVWRNSEALQIDAIFAGGRREGWVSLSR